MDYLDVRDCESRGIHGRHVSHLFWMDRNLPWKESRHCFTHADNLAEAIRDARRILGTTPRAVSYQGSSVPFKGKKTYGALMREIPYLDH